MRKIKLLFFKIMKLALTLITKFTSNEKILKPLFFYYHSLIIRDLKTNYLMDDDQRNFKYSKEKKSDEIPKRGFVLWYQGIENAPDLVLVCIESIKRNFDGEIIVLTGENYHHYTKIPDHLIFKFEKGIISRTHFSDIIRMSVLFENGGVWFDSTIFLSDKLKYSDFSKNLITIKSSKPHLGINISSKRWTGFFIGAPKGYELFSFVLDFFSEYWKYENSLIDYLLIDYVIYLGYENNIGGFKEDIELLNYTNENNYALIDNINTEITEELTKKIFYSGTNVFKLSYKKRIINNSNNYGNKLLSKEIFQIIN